MSQPLIWLHEQALYLAPYLTAIPNAQFMHIWDDDYYQQRQYTLKDWSLSMNHCVRATYPSLLAIRLTSFIPGSQQRYTYPTVKTQ